MFRTHGSEEQSERGKGMTKVPLISKWSLCAAVVALVLGSIICVTTATAQGDPGAAPVVLDSDTAPLIPGIQNILLGAADTGGKAPGEPGATGFRIISVKNIEGNNPLHPTQPVLNFGGVVVANVEDLLECIRGGVCKPGGGGTQGTRQCSPSSTTTLHPVYGPASAALYINPNTSACAAGHSAPALQEEGFYVYPTYCMMPDPSGSTINIYPGSGYQISGIASLLSEGSYTFTLKKGTKSWRISMEVKKTGSSMMTCGVPTIVNVWTLTIKSITPLS
ncbi:MAG TPA: hypothetical protein PK344_00750 [Syntrophorhabdaceae bacterium]|nr:hypothetical protein [Syntrophorhabdaceae bacterium]